MPESPDDVLAALQQRSQRNAARALGGVRRAEREHRTEETETWLAAGDNLAEKAIAALDAGDEERARRLAQRIVALPIVDESVPAGPMAVSAILYHEVLDPSFDDGDGHGLLDLPLRLLPTLDPWGADALRHALAAITDYDLPAAVLRRIRAVAPLETRLEPPFAHVSESDLPDALLSALRVVLLLRSAED